MSENYQVLALKWRPKQFKDVVGQDHITNTLQKAFEKNRIAQAFLFAGPRGVGKTTTARLVAMSLNGSDNPTTDFDLKHDGVPIFAKTFTPTDTTKLNPVTGVFSIRDHFFSN